MKKKTLFIKTIHDEFGCPLWECEKIYDLICKYICLRHPIGDHPEEYMPREYDLVERKENVDI